MFFACSPLYIPSARTLTHLSGKGEVNASGMIDFSGLEARAAWSITNHVMVHGSFSKSIYGLANTRDTTAFTGMNGSHNHKMLEIGAGYYGNVFGLYSEFEAGYGHGKSHAFDHKPYDPDGGSPKLDPSRVIDAEYDRFYAQAGAKLQSGRHARLSLSARVSVLKFSKMESQLSRLVVETDNLFVFIEPAVDFKYYFDRVPIYAMVNVGLSRRADSGPGRTFGLTNYNTRPEFWGFSQVFGIGVHLGKLKHERKNL